MKEGQMIRLEQDLREIRRILSQKPRDRKVRIYLFGSKALGGTSETLDIDVAIFPKRRGEHGECA